MWQWCRENPFLACIVAVIIAVSLRVILVAYSPNESKTSTKAFASEQASIKNALDAQTNAIEAQTKAIQELNRTLRDRLPAR